MIIGDKKGYKKKQNLLLYQKIIVPLHRKMRGISSSGRAQHWQC